MKNFQFPYQTTHIDSLNGEMQHVIKSATGAAATAYAPYSRFYVGAAVLLDDGDIITGANLENAAYPAGICAERAALSSLNLHDGRKVKAIAISYLSESSASKTLSPCGVCRQFILEVQLHQKSPIAVYMSGPADDIVIVEDASWLLPFHFSSDYL